MCPAGDAIAVPLDFKRSVPYLFLAVFVTLALSFLYSFTHESAPRPADDPVDPRVPQYLRTVAAYCEAVHLETSNWPATWDELTRMLPEYLRQDPWGRPCRLEPFDESLGYGVLLCRGSDGRIGGRGTARDVAIRYGVAETEADIEQGVVDEESRIDR